MGSHAVSVCRALDRNESPEPELEVLAHQLDAAYRRTAETFRPMRRFGSNRVKGAIPSR